MNSRCSLEEGSTVTDKAQIMQRLGEWLSVLIIINVRFHTDTSFSSFAEFLSSASQSKAETVRRYPPH